MVPRKRRYLPKEVVLFSVSLGRGLTKHPRCWCSPLCCTETSQGEFLHLCDASANSTLPLKVHKDGPQNPRQSSFFNIFFFFYFFL